MEDAIKLPRRPKDVPIGTIVAWAGTPALLQTSTKEWLICDGSKIPKRKFPELYDILSDNWGAKTGGRNGECTLPDLRAMFLRGVNQDRNDEYDDPDIDERKKYDGTKFKGVGSCQIDEFMIHNHPPLNSKNFGVQGPGGLALGHPGHSQADPTTGNRGGKETRPKNAYVYWIIKAK